MVALQRAIDSRDSEMERPYDWIAYDPDFVPLKASGRDQYPAFKRFLRDTKRRDYPRRPRPTDDPREGDGTSGDGAGLDGDDGQDLAPVSGRGGQRSEQPKVPQPGTFARA